MAIAKLKKSILAKLDLNSKDFEAGLSTAEKSLIGFGATATGVAAAAATLTKVMANYQDETMKSARAAGLNAAEFSGLQHAAEQAAVETGTFREIMAKLNDSTGDIGKRFQKMGIDMSKMNGEAKTSSELISELADQVKAAQTPTEKTSIAMAAFGEMGGKMVSFLDNGADGLERLKQEAFDLGIVVDDFAGQQAEKFNDSLDSLGKSVKGVGNTFSQTLIEMVNSSGAINMVKNAITGITKWWREMDKETRKAIITTLAFASGVAIAAGAVGAFLALKPKILEFFTSIKKGAALSSLGIGVLITIAIALAKKIHEKWGQMQTVVQPLADSFDRIKKSITRLSDAFDSVSDAVDDMTKFGANTDKASKSVDIFGTVAKGALGTVSVLLQGLLLPINLVISAIGSLLEATSYASKAVKAMLAGDFKKAAILGKIAINEIKLGMLELEKQAVDAGHNIQETFKDPIVYNIDSSQIDDAITKKNQLTENPVRIEVGDGPKQIDPLIESFKDLDKAMGSTEYTAHKVAVALAKVLDEAAKKAQVVTGAFSQLAEASAAEIQHTLDVMNRDFEVANRMMAEDHQAARDLMEQQENDFIAKLTAGFDREIAELTKAENDKIAILENGAAMRIAMADEEFQKKKAIADQEFQNFLATEQAKWEADKALKLKKTTDKENRQLAESLIDEQWLTFKEDQEALHKEKLEEMAATHGDAMNEIKNQEQTKLEKRQARAARRIARIEERKAKQLVKAEERKAKRLAALEEKQLKEKEAMEKKQARLQWKAQLQMFETTKSAKIAETVASGIAAAAQAFAALAPIPFIGPGLGAAAAAVIIAATHKRVGLIEKEKPIKPAILMEFGGLVPGRRRHRDGGIHTELESEELVIDRPRSRRILNAIEGAVVNNNNQNQSKIEFHMTIVNDSHANPEQFANKVMEIAAIKLRHEGVGFAR